MLCYYEYPVLPFHNICYHIITIKLLIMLPSLWIKASRFGVEGLGMTPDQAMA